MTQAKDPRSTSAPAGAQLNLHAVLERSRANGPGERMVIWTQGCDLDCPGCFNPETHGFAPREPHGVVDLARRIVDSAPALDGLTVSGGEPLAQATPLAALLRLVRVVRVVRVRTTLSVLLFSGYTLAEIRRDAERAAVLDHVDVLVAGRYASRRRAGHALLGSSNQTVHLLTPRHTLDEIRAVPECEMHLGRDGSVRMTGIAPPLLTGPG